MLGQKNIDGVLGVAFILGYFAAGSDPGTRSLSGLGTARRCLNRALDLTGIERYAIVKRSEIVYNDQAGPVGGAKCQMY